MTTVVNICNLALANLADAANVSSIDPPEGSAQADHCAMFYPIARDTILESHAWSFATRRILLSALTPEWDDFAYAYSKPNGALKILSVYDPSMTDATLALQGVDVGEYIIETDSNGNEVIMTDIPDAACRFIIQVTDTSKFSQHCINTIAAYLSSLLAGPIIQGKEGISIADYWMNKAMAMLNQAKTMDAQSQRRRLTHTPSGIRARD